MNCGFPFLKGYLDVIFDQDSITDIHFTTQPNPNWTSAPKQLEQQFRAYAQGQLRQFNLPIKLQGTPFQIKVLNAMLKIPYGEVRSYKAIAEIIGHPKAFRAVGQACHANRLPIVVPCHRVVGSQGLGGYAYGLDMKVKLIQLEKRTP